jgi:methionyl-tRNA formyltransferase
MRAVVFGYSNVGDRCLRVLAAAGVELALVVTHHDHPGERRWFARVADTAAELGAPVVYAEDLASEALAARVSGVAPDIIFSFYFRAMLPMSLLACARLGAFNMHGSLLPEFRGRAPTNWAVLKGATRTGATLHRMQAKPDAGAIVDQCAVPILPDDTAREVFDKVCVAAEIVLWRSLPALLAGTAPQLPNDITRGSYFGGRRPEDGRIDWRQPASEVYNLIRAVAPPYPGAFTDLGSRRLIVARARLGGLRSAPAASASLGADGAPGLRVRDAHILGVCGDGREIDIHELLYDGRPIDPPELARWLRTETETP